MIQPDASVTIPSPYYRVSLKALLFDAAQRALVLQTKDGNCQLPGGGWEHTESMQHCLRREVMEALGIGVIDIDFDQMYPYSSRGKTGNMCLKLAMKVIADGTDFRPERDVIVVRYVTAQELAKLPMLDSEAGIKTHIDRIWG